MGSVRGMARGACGPQRAGRFRGAWVAARALVGPSAHALLGLSACALVGLAGCALQPGGQRAHSVYQQERFQSDETFSRLFDADVKDTCEAARRALLSQGYVITAAQAGTVTGSKRFQPQGDVHMEISFNIVCVSESTAGQVSTAYVSAQQDRYVIRRVANNTSLGLGSVGSISVPLSSSEDSLVKVGSETIPAGQFYDRFFALMQRLLGDIRSAGNEAS